LSEGSAISKANAINAIANKTGVIASAKASSVTFNATGATSPDDKFKFLLNGVVISGTVEAEGSNVGSANDIAAAVNAQTAQTGVYATVGENGAYTLTASDGRNIVLSTDKTTISKAQGIDPTSEAAKVGEWGTTGIDSGTPTWIDMTTGENKALVADDGSSMVIYGSIDLSTDSLQGITIGGTSAQINQLGIKGDYYVASSSSGSGVGSVNLNTSSGAQSALTTLDRAINTVTDMRAAMGAYQNRLTASISNLENTSMNLTASRSRILDTDYAKETTNLAKAQIIQQAATAMLAQANQSAQSVLALLK
jgi:flagellin